MEWNKLCVGCANNATQQKLSESSAANYKIFSEDCFYK